MTTTIVSSKDYDQLQERYQVMWFENNQLRNLVERLQDRIDELEETLRYEQDFK